MSCGCLPGCHPSPEAGDGTFSSAGDKLPIYMRVPVKDAKLISSGNRRLLTRGELTVSYVEATDVDFPSDRLVAAGYRHPESTREGLGRFVAWLRRPADG